MPSTKTALAIGLSTSIVVAGAGVAEATMPPARDGTFPDAVLEVLDSQPASLTFNRAFLALVRQTERVRNALSIVHDDPSYFLPMSADLTGPAEITGIKSIPVLLGKYDDTAADPFDATALQGQLFGPWPASLGANTGTLSDYYREISYNRFTVTGIVRPWFKLKNKAQHYEGLDYSKDGKTEHCYGLCKTAHIGELLKELLDDATALDWGTFDNDGPDGRPNSGDDDGFADFVAFVHPATGGECQTGTGIWSHQSSYSNRTGAPYVTSSKGASGGFIKVDDYVIMPALACGGARMIEIGVFAHEFGHALDLPDLYDTDSKNGKSAGVGHWCLMAAGSWGGDGKSPERPVHLSAWGKRRMGWVSPIPVTGDLKISIPPYETHAVVYQLPISLTQHYLVQNSQRLHFDQNLLAPGLLVWKINTTAVKAGLPNNRVNADHNNQGVELVEADGLSQLDTGTRGDDGDPFPGKTARKRFDNTTTPKSLGKTALCDIDGAQTISVRVRAASGSCTATASSGTPSDASDSHGGTASSHETVDDGEQPKPGSPDGAATVSVKDAAQISSGELVRVVGELQNVGKSYFKASERKIVLQDPNTGERVAVQWTGPLETSTSRSPDAPDGPMALSELLGKSVEIVARVDQRINGPVLVVREIREANE